MNELVVGSVKIEVLSPAGGFPYGLRAVLFFHKLHY